MKSSRKGFRHSLRTVRNACTPRNLYSLKKRKPLNTSQIFHDRTVTARGVQHGTYESMTRDSQGFNNQSFPVILCGTGCETPIGPIGGMEIGSSQHACGRAGMRLNGIGRINYAWIIGRVIMQSCINHASEPYQPVYHQ